MDGIRGIFNSDRIRIDREEHIQKKLIYAREDINDDEEDGEDRNFHFHYN
jgi:hypothetical protein